VVKALHWARRLPWIDIVAAMPVVAIVLLAPDFTLELARLDPLVVFRVLLTLWVLVHIFLTLQRFFEDLMEVGEFLRDIERADARVKGLAKTGHRVFLWSLWRVMRLALRCGWPTAFLAASVVAVNAVTWLVLAGWRPAFLAPLLSA
jgi:hypothetical protein